MNSFKYNITKRLFQSCASTTFTACTIFLDHFLPFERASPASLPLTAQTTSDECFEFVAFPRRFSNFTLVQVVDTPAAESGCSFVFSEVSTFCQPPPEARSLQQGYLNYTTPASAEVFMCTITHSHALTLIVKTETYPVLTEWKLPWGL